MSILRKLSFIIGASVILTACGTDSGNTENDSAKDVPQEMAISTVVMEKSLTPIPTEKSSSKPMSSVTDKPAVPARSTSPPTNKKQDASQKKMGRDGIFGTFPCRGSGPSQFISNFYSIDSITGISPMGKMASSHVTPTDHLYIHRNPNPDIAQDNEYVVAPADGVIVKISRFPEDQQYIYEVPNPKTVPA